MTKEEALKTYYGYDVFRGGQEAVIDALLSGRDALAIMPTGAGKSVCYQIPALLLSGITLVVSPLVSLMRDQVTQLVQMGIPAAFLNSSLTFRQYLLALDRARAGRYKIIYVAPERLETEGFQAFVREADISLVAVDEAHCISQWGQDFRPSYLNIPAFVESLPHRPPVGAFTATATPDVKADIHRLLDLQDPLELTTGFDRENLYFDVVKLDGSLTRPLLKSHTNQKIVRSIIELGQELGVNVIAEFVENREQRDLLDTLGCHCYQGYLYAKPLELEAFITYMKQMNEK